MTHQQGMREAKEGLFHFGLFLNHPINLGQFLRFPGPVRHVETKLPALEHLEPPREPVSWEECTLLAARRKSW